VAGIGFLPEGQPPVVVPAVIRRKKRLLRSSAEYKSMEPGVYGGPIAEQPLSPGLVREIGTALCAMKKSGGRLVETPLAPLDLPATFTAKEMSTHIITLRQPYEAVAKTFGRGQKSNINQARRKGVQVRRAVREQDIEQYYDIYLQTLRRWSDAKGQAYPRELFFNLYRQQDPHVQFWLAEAEGALIAGILVLAWQGSLVYWHGCARKEYFNLYPNNLLHATVIQKGCEDGAAYYDMGPSMDIPGVIKFKESFGARQRAFKAYRWKP
jgi:lipid II:glycine glycyltransferase (peptidoglycan interpeptide bridge formation enzyme)